MAWNRPGGSGPHEPWQRPPTNRSPQQQLWRRLKPWFTRFGKGPGGLAGIVLAFVLVLLVLGSQVVIGTGEVGVVLRLGRYDRLLGPGMHFKWPRPIETVVKTAAGRTHAVSDNALELTQDGALVNVEYTVQYEVDDLRKYLFSAEDADGTVAVAAQAAVRAVIGQASLDRLLADRGTTLADAAAQALQRRLDAYGVGIRVSEISLQSVSPPAEVKDAFDDVDKAREEKSSAEVEARAYAGKVLPAARSEAAKTLAEAQAYKAERIARAQGETAQFNLLLAAYRAAPALTRRRLWLETMEEVLAGQHKVIAGGNGQVSVQLPSTPAPAPAASAGQSAATPQAKP